MAKRFGGEWTERKLDIVEEYLRKYLTVMKNQPWFGLGYIDAFAGDGSIQLATSEDEDVSEIKEFVRGSAVRALELDPGFDGYVFIEQDKSAVERLHLLSKEYPHRKVQIRDKEANEELQRICREHEWRRRRAVTFLDPTGMQVEWETMLALAETSGIDVWIWFPLGVGVNRLLTRDGNIPPKWREALNRIFGTDEWEGHFYDQIKEHTLFGIEERTQKTATPEGIARFYNKRLAEIFPAVSAKPKIMRNSKNTPIYLLCFASANPGKGGKIAVRIADYLLDRA